MIFLYNSSNTSISGSDQESLRGLAVGSFRALGLAVQCHSHQLHVAIRHWQGGDSKLRYTVGVK